MPELYIESRILNLARRLFAPIGHQVTRHTKLVGDLNLDSLRLLELVLEIEDLFGVTLEEKRFDVCETLGELIDYVKALKES